MLSTPKSIFEKATTFKCDRTMSIAGQIENDLKSQFFKAKVTAILLMWAAWVCRRPRRFAAVHAWTRLAAFLTRPLGRSEIVSTIEGGKIGGVRPKSGIGGFR